MVTPESIKRAAVARGSRVTTAPAEPGGRRGMAGGHAASKWWSSDRCAYSTAATSCRRLPPPPVACNATRPCRDNISRSPVSAPSRPVNDRFRNGTRHTCGNSRQPRTPGPPASAERAPAREHGLYRRRTPSPHTSQNTGRAGPSPGGAAAVREGADRHRRRPRPDHPDTGLRLNQPRAHAVDLGRHQAARRLRHRARRSPVTCEARR